MSARQPDKTKRKRRSSDDEDVEVTTRSSTISRPKTPPRSTKAARTIPPETPPPPPPPPSTQPRPAFANASPNTIHRAEHASDTPRASTTLPPPTGFHTTSSHQPNPSAAAGPSHAIIPPHIAKHLMEVDHTNPAIIRETAERNAIGENERRIRRGILGFVRKAVAKEQTRREEWENPIVTTEGWPVEYGGLGSRPVWAQDQVENGGMEGGGVFGAAGSGNGEGEEPAERAEAAAAAAAATDGEGSGEAADEVDDPDATEDELDAGDEDEDDDDDDDEIVWLGTRTVWQH